MKKILTLLIVLISAQQTQAKIWRINNNPSLSADLLQATNLFNNFTGVGDPEAAAGDTIYFEPSTSTYSGISINKLNIVVIGYGYFLSDNPGLQVNANNSRVSSIEFLSTSTGSSMSGIEATSSVYIDASNITVTRCYLPTTYLYGFASNASGIRIDKCYINGNVAEQSIPPTITSVTIAVENCIFAGLADNNGVGGINLGQKVRGLCRNNTFNGANNMYCFNFYVANNIFVGNTNFGNVSQSGNNVFRNNLLAYNSNAQNSFVTNAAPNSGNVFAVNMANVFVGPTNNTTNGTSIFNDFINLPGFTKESRFDLKPGPHAAVAGGETGTTFSLATVTTPNCGSTGATDPYRKAGIPAIPTIYALTVPATISNGASTMNISISSRSNN